MDPELAKALEVIDIDPTDPLVICATTAALDIHMDAWETAPFANEDWAAVARWTGIIIRNVPAFMRQ